MANIIVNTGKVEVMFVEVPSEAHNIVIGHTHGYGRQLAYCSKKYIPDNYRDVHVDLPFPCLLVANSSTSLTEEQAREIVERWDNGKYNDYVHHLSCVDTALESYQSLKISNGVVDFNKYGNKCPSPVKYMRNIIIKSNVRVQNHDYDRWQEEQSKVRRYVVLVGDRS